MMVRIHLPAHATNQALTKDALLFLQWGLFFKDISLLIHQKTAVMSREFVPRAFSIKQRLYAPFPRKAFQHIHRFMRLDCVKYTDGIISILGDNIITYKRKADFRETTVALTDSRVNVTIKVFGHYRFDGYVLSVDEFKLIWERIL